MPSSTTNETEWLPRNFNFVHRVRLMKVILLQMHFASVNELIKLSYSPQKTITMNSPDFALLTLTRRGQTGSSRQTASISSAPDKNNCRSPGRVIVSHNELI